MSEPLTKDLLHYEDFGNDAFYDWQVVSALEGLRGDMNDFYHSIGKPKVWAQSNDELCDLCEEHAKMLVDKWFPFLNDNRRNAEGELHRTMTPPITKETTSLSSVESVVGGSELDEQLEIKEVSDLFSKIWYGITDRKRLEYRKDAERISELLLFLSQPRRPRLKRGVKQNE